MGLKNFRVETTHETYFKLYNAICTGRPFIYSRYGDGDFCVMLQDTGDSQQAFNPELAAELQATFLHEAPDNLVGVCMHEPEEGMKPGLFYLDEGWLHPLYVDWINENCAERVFENAVALHYYSVFCAHELRHLIFQIKKVEHKIFVGNTSRELVESVFGPLTHYIPTEYVDCYDGVKQWWPEVDAATNDGGLVLEAAGLSTRAINRRLLTKGFAGQALDLGSLIDFLTGNVNRTWIHMAGDVARRRVLRSV